MLQDWPGSAHWGKPSVQHGLETQCANPQDQSTLNEYYAICPSLMEEIQEMGQSPDHRNDAVEVMLASPLHVALQ